MDKKVLYSAVVLSDKSRTELLKKIENKIPEGWDIILHHMTICLGELPENLKIDIGKQVKLKVIGVGRDDMAMAFKVDGYYSNNKIKHITIAINRKNGAKPVMSNNIKQWYEFDEQNLYVNGNVEEITN